VAPRSSSTLRASPELAVGLGLLAEVDLGTENEDELPLIVFAAADTELALAAAVAPAFPLDVAFEVVEAILELKAVFPTAFPHFTNLVQPSAKAPAHQSPLEISQ